jgi:hypothetical protein
VRRRRQPQELLERQRRDADRFEVALDEGDLGLERRDLLGEA